MHGCKEISDVAQRYTTSSSVVMPIAMETIQNDDVVTFISTSSHTISPLKLQADDQGCVMAVEKSRKSLRNRPYINYRQFDDSSDEESHLEIYDRKVGLKSKRKKKGIIRGCPDCENCQKVLARWRPEDACRPVLDEAPVFYPSEEEFADTLKYIESIREKAEPYGICCIVPPSSWKPSCPLKEKLVWENSKFTTRVQRVDLLQNRNSTSQMSKVSSGVMRKRQRLSTTGTELGNSNGTFVKNDRLCHYDNSSNFGFEPGPEFTLESFQKYADDFKNQYFYANDANSDKNIGLDHPQRWEPSEEDIEGEYWRIVEKATEEIEVLYGADLETGEFGSGFPKESSAASDHNLEDDYVKTGWNLNKFPRLMGSVLSFESDDISGVLVPWLYIGMCFSSFCWHVEDHHFYSLNYMHWGSPKTWYGVPGKDALQLEAAMKKHLPDLFVEQPDLLHKLVTQFSPSLLRAEGVPVYRCVQHSGEFILTFPRAYHSGFNCGFNCAEAVNVAPIDWLPHGQKAVELYRDQARKISVSHDKLLLGAARKAVRSQWDMLFLKKMTPENLIWKNICGWDKILVNALKIRVEMERVRRECFLSSQSRKMDSSFDTNDEKECFICHYDLHLSAAGCPCSSDKFACLDHAKQMCTCDWSKRFFLFRYEINELNILIDALGGKLSAVHKWGMSDLGLSLSSYVTNSKSKSEAKKEGKLNEGVSSHSASCNEQSCSQKGNRQITENGNQSNSRCGTLHEKGAEFGKKQPTKESLNATGCQLSKESSQNTIQSSIEVSNSEDQSTIKDANNTLPNSDGEERPLSTGNHTIMYLNGREHKESLQSIADKMNEDLSARIKDSDDQFTACDDRDQVRDICETNASGMIKNDAVLDLLVEEAGLLTSHSKAKEEGKDEILRENNYIPRDQPLNSNHYLRNPHDAWKKESYYDSFNSRNKSQNSHIHENVDATDASKSVKVEMDSLHPKSEKPQAVIGNQSCSPIIAERYLQKGVRIAKIVRRINYNVEVLEYGVVHSGSLWSTRHAIFPNGYKSRVKYLNILDPTQMCSYISQILDGGLHGPLFMVQVEHCPNEVFIHLTPTKSWDMVRERVNHEIRRIHSIGKSSIPTLQHPCSIDGLEMFGLCSPPIIQAIEAIDYNQISMEYWRHKPQKQKQATISSGAKEETDVHDTFSLASSNSILEKLFEKADCVELQLLHQLLTTNRLDSNQEIIQILMKAKQRCSRPAVSDHT